MQGKKELLPKVIYQIHINDLVPENDIDEPLTWHSTISRTRQLYGEEVFLELFRKVLSLWLSKGMVKGKRQDTPGYCYRDGKEGNSGEFIQSKLLSNHTHYSTTDPDSRISTKPGKPRNLNYLGQLSVDTANHVITGAMADFADKLVLMSALTYNLKKYLKFINKRAISKAIAIKAEIQSVFFGYFTVFWLIFCRFKPVFSSMENDSQKNTLPLKRIF